MSISKGLVIYDSRASAVLFRFLRNKTNKRNIILPVNICPIVPQIALKAGFNVEYVDINGKDLSMDMGRVVEILETRSESYSGILYNYTYGIDSDIPEAFELIKLKFPNLFVIEDKCSNIPSMKHSKHADMTLYSTGYAKQVDLNHGGYGVLNFPLAGDSDEMYTFNIQMNEKALAININSVSISEEDYMGQIDENRCKIMEQKQKLNAIYDYYLPSEIVMGSAFNNWRYHIKTENKNKIINEIFSNGLFASNHYRPLSDSNHFPIAKKLHESVINLFNDFYFNEKKAESVCRIINKNL